MYGFIVETDSNQSLKRLGDKLILSLYKDKIIAKYNIFGKKIFIETSESLTKKNNLNGSFAPAIMSNSEQNEIYDRISKVINRVNEPATEKQLAYIRKLGGEPTPAISKRQASELIDILKNVEKLELAGEEEE